MFKLSALMYTLLLLAFSWLSDFRLHPKPALAFVCALWAGMLVRSIVSSAVILLRYSSFPFAESLLDSLLPIGLSGVIYAASVITALLLHERRKLASSAALAGIAALVAAALALLRDLALGAGLTLTSPLVAAAFVFVFCLSMLRMARPGNSLTVPLWLAFFLGGVAAIAIHSMMYALQDVVLDAVGGLTGLPAPALGGLVFALVLPVLNRAFGGSAARLTEPAQPVEAGKLSVSASPTRALWLRRRPAIGYMFFGFVAVVLVLCLLVSMRSESTLLVPGGMNILFLIVGIWSLRTPAIVADEGGLRLNLALLRKPYLLFADITEVEILPKKVVFVTSRKRYKFPLSLLEPMGQRELLEYVRHLFKP